MKAKYLAGTSLAIMGAGFLGTFPFHQTMAGAVIHGGFEAGLVGGLADWFAVTALFRHPLNVPIPHTALLPKNRKKVTDALVNMIENEWLTKESITDKLQQVNIADNLVAAVEKQLPNLSLQNGLATILEKAIYQIDKEKLAILIEKEGKEYLHSVDTKAIFSSMVDYCIQHEYDEKAFDFLLMKIINWVEKEDTRQLLGEIAMNALNNAQQEGFLQFAIKSIRNFLDEEKLGTALQNALIKGLPNLSDSDNENREVILQHIHDGLTSLSENEEVADNLEKWKDDFVHNLDMNAQIIKLLEQFQEKAVAFIKQDNFYEVYCLPFLESRINSLKENNVYMEKIEKWIQNQIVRIVEDNHEKIGILVNENLNKLDNETLTQMIEKNVGKELQWIRVNGAICGFVIGLGLEAVKLLM